MNKNSFINQFSENIKFHYIRIETTINNPKSLGLKKPVLFLQAYLWHGLGCNDRLLNCCADVDTSTIYEGEADPFDQPVLDHKDRKITPPDLRKERQLALCEELLKPKYAVNGFKTAELQRALSGIFGNSAQIRYEIQNCWLGVPSKNKKVNYFKWLQDLDGNGFGHQLPLSAILKTL